MEKITYHGKMIEVVEAPVTMSGVTKTFEYARRSPGVRLIIPRDGSVLISKEFRHELNGYDYRLPGGKVYDTLVEYNDALSSGADIAVAAQAAAVKEAQEEVGVGVEEAQIFHRSVCGASVVWDLYYFVVSRFSEGERHAEAGEDIRDRKSVV